MTKPPPEVNYTFNERELEQLKSYGDIRAHNAGDVLFREGQHNIDCVVGLTGEVEIFIETKDGEERVGWMEPGQFAGDLSVLTGQATMARAIMKTDGDMLHIPHDRFQTLLVEDSHLSDVFVRAFTARRAWSQQSGRSAVMVIGAPYDRSVFTVRDLLTKHNIPHAWLNPDCEEVAKPIMAARGFTETDLPVVLRGGVGGTLKNPSIETLSQAFGLDLLPDNATADVIVVGAGPGGLAASVYAASEGLSVLTIDTQGPGGQAGTSSKIENYLGFPMGVSGRELAERASVQAQKFGVRIASPAAAQTLKREDDTYCLTLKDGRALKSRAVVIATGAQYRRLPIDKLEHYEGRGVYYGATPMEAQLCADSAVAVVGAGNSAGQGAVFLSQTAREVHVLFRRDDIRETMSEYLVRRLEEAPNIHLHSGCSIQALIGVEDADPEADRLTGIDIVNGQQPSLARLDTPFVFLFIGAAPGTGWLPETMAVDDRGFLKTGSDLENLELVKAGWSLNRMPSRFETSWPQVYAVGDVRTGSIKRVASAVGEGSVVVSDIHQALAEGP